MKRRRGTQRRILPTHSRRALVLSATLANWPGCKRGCMRDTLVIRFTFHLFGDRMQVAQSSAEKSRQIYLAGFDVFRPDAAEHGEHLKALCIERGLTGLYPSDSGLPSGLSARVAARWIC